MGFDLNGINPKLKKGVKEPQPPKDWSNQKQTDSYFAELDKFRTENRGAYFRNNIWRWSPLWEYVCLVCSDILSEQDEEKGYFNDGHIITESKAEKIARRLRNRLNEGHTSQYEKVYKDKRRPFSEGNVKEFVEFCVNSGGFAIH